ANSTIPQKPPPCDTIAGMIPRNAHHPEDTRELSELLRAESLGLFGVAEAQQETARAETEYSRWITAGHNGSMEYLNRHAEMKYHPARVLPGCRSVMVVAMNYFQPSGPAASGVGAESDSGRVARYAWGRDYHNALGKRLKRVVRELRLRHPDETFRSFVDSSPLSERFFAERAGIGFTAKNTLTASSAYGSWFFLGEILSTVEYPPTPAPEGLHGGCPRGCFRCGEACPTGALFAPHRIDATRCISYLTIEHRGRIPEELRPLMGDWIFGCDLCQETCPLNIRARTTEVSDFSAHRTGERIKLGEILSIEDEGSYRSRFAGTPLLRPGRAAMIRNAAIAAANTGSIDLLPKLRELARDDNVVIREHARWAVDQLIR
ncbi:MAG: tRNA epoxyqueuosine(34) reductase QueG, partial [Spirochaetaceae bacterium]|nr:tRNA epoxyqueuosine(34) reductase QueG [Spirochaetaceae bacterium]